ncbi:MAG: hypothetical protein WC635_08835 [Bacteriovorax sp.]|jgi:hypothetical protein
MLEGLFGNKSAEKVMFSIFLHGELHASAIAQIHKTALDPIKKQLERFEESGFLISRTVGRSKLYKFNEQNPMIKPLKQLLLIAKKNTPRLINTELENNR